MFYPKKIINTHFKTANTQLILLSMVNTCTQFHIFFICFSVLRLRLYTIFVCYINCTSIENSKSMGQGSVSVTFSNNSSYTNPQSKFCFFYIGITLSVRLSIYLYVSKGNSSWTDVLIQMTLHSCKVKPKDVHAGGWSWCKY